MVRVHAGANEMFFIRIMLSSSSWFRTSPSHGEDRGFESRWECQKRYSLCSYTLHVRSKTNFSSSAVWTKQTAVTVTKTRMTKTSRAVPVNSSSVYVTASRLSAYGSSPGNVTTSARKSTKASIY